MSRRKRMTEDERVRLLDIRKRGKCAKPVTPEEHAFCDRMYERDREGYVEVEAEMCRWLDSANWWELI